MDLANLYNGLSPATKFLFWSVVKIAFAIGILHAIAAYAVLAERKISAWIQDRVGPNRVAPPLSIYPAR